MRLKGKPALVRAVLLLTFCMCVVWCSVSQVAHSL